MDALMMANRAERAKAKYKAGPGGATERIGSPSYKSPSNNLVRKEARIVRTYPKRY